MRVALGGAAGLADELEPRLRMARLVLHHRRVVELRLVVGRDVQELRGHVAREHVRLELLGQDRAPHVLAPSLPLRRSLPLGDGRQLAPREVPDLPLLPLRQIVEAEDAGESLAALGGHLDQLARRHPGRLLGLGVDPSTPHRGRAGLPARVTNAQLDRDCRLNPSLSCSGGFEALAKEERRGLDQGTPGGARAERRGDVDRPLAVRQRAGNADRRRGDPGVGGRPARDRPRRVRPRGALRPGDGDGPDPR